ncbi:MAG: DUF2029 domain-containing protein [Clostridia bacterium]|nr:DUF2029 domain-containing protein [Clostridia bacterium]
MKKKKTKAPEGALKQRKGGDDTLMKAFLAFFAINTVVCYIFAMISRGDTWTMTLFYPDPNPKDHFMDFFNSMRDAGTRDVYVERGVIYPPLANLLFFIASKVVSPEVISTPFRYRHIMSVDQMSMMLYVFYAAAMLLCMYELVRHYLATRDQKRYAVIFAMCMLICYPTMYCLERGNITMLSMILSMVFLFCRNSKNNAVRELSYVCLALAAGIKIYPALYGILLLFEKKYKDAARLVLYGVICFFLPFAFYGGVSGALQLVENIRTFTAVIKSGFVIDSVSVENLCYNFGLENPMIGKGIFALTELLAVGSTFLLKKQWQKVTMLTYVILNIQSTSSYYAMVFMIIPFVLFLVENKGKKLVAVDWIYWFCFSFFITQIPTLYHFVGTDVMFNFFYNVMGTMYSEKINQFVSLYLFQMLFLLLLLEAFWAGVTTLRAKLKNKKAPAVPAEAPSGEELHAEGAV